MARKNYSEEFRKEAVRLLTTSGKTQKEIADDLGVSSWTLGQWKRKARSEEPQFLSSIEAERIKQLEKENRLLREERDILKKAMGIVSKQ